MISSARFGIMRVVWVRWRLRAPLRVPVAFSLSLIQSCRSLTESQPTQSLMRCSTVLSVWSDGHEIAADHDLAREVFGDALDPHGVRDGGIVARHQMAQHQRLDAGLG